MARKGGGGGGKERMVDGEKAGALMIRECVHGDWSAKRDKRMGKKVKMMVSIV